MVFTMFIALGALLLVVVCLAALSGPVRIRSWPSPASFLCLSRGVQLGLGQEPYGRVFSTARFCGRGPRHRHLVSLGMC